MQIKSTLICILAIFLNVYLISLLTAIYVYHFVMVVIYNLQQYNDFFS